MKKLILMFALSLVSLMSSAQELKFPELKSTYLKTGDFVNRDDLSKVRLGLSKDQVRLLIGNPHFSEGIFNPHVWNYAFNFYKSEKTLNNEFITCQYQVQFDDKSRVKATYWKDGQCSCK